MNARTLPPLLLHFVELEDPRVERTKHHQLLDIVGVALCAVLCGADIFVAMEQFGLAKLDWLKTFLGLPNGIPSHDTIGRVFALIKPEKFAHCFGNWAASICPSLNLQSIGIDGKTSRGSGDKEDKPLHLVSAWANEARLSLGQIAVEDKSNEITAIPKLLEILELKGAIVTIDAMGTQKDIAEKIVEKEADYILPVKENHPHLFEDCEKMFTRFVESEMTAFAHDVFSKENKGHGRTELRTVWVFTDIKELRDWSLWKDLKSLIVVVRECWQGGKHSIEVSYFISSRKATAAEFYHFIRDHWGIENKCHWVLDVYFGEDDSRVREGHAPENFSCLRRMDMAILRTSHGAKGGFKTRRLIAGWDVTSLEKILFTTPREIDAITVTFTPKGPQGAVSIYPPISIKPRVYKSGQTYTIPPAWRKEMEDGLSRQVKSGIEEGGVIRRNDDGTETIVRAAGRPGIDRTNGAIKPPAYPRFSSDSSSIANYHTHPDHADSPGWSNASPSGKDLKFVYLANNNAGLQNFVIASDSVYLLIRPAKLKLNPQGKPSMSLRGRSRQRRASQRQW